jgi:hypothetical protein
MAYMVLAPKPVPRILVPTIRRMIFSTKYVMEIGISPLVAYCRIAAKPVTPPPIIPLGVRNIAHPNAYIVRPTVIRKYSLISVPIDGL